MSLRARLTVLATGVVAVTIVAASLIVYVLMRSDLRKQVDASMRARAEQIQAQPFTLREFNAPFFNELPSEKFGSARDYAQLVNSTGAHIRSPGLPGPIPISNRTKEVAAGTSAPYFTDTEVAGVHARLLTVPLANGVALQLVRSLREVDHDVRRLRLVLILVTLGGVAAAAAGGAFVSRTALAPVARLTHAAERVARTRDTSERVPAPGRDELSRLGTSFNTMLAELDDVIETQRRFVADASHELRTPLTSLQTNIQVLARTPRLSQEDKERLLADVERELQEMRVLVGGLVELARGRDDKRQLEEVRLDEIVEECVERARARFPGLTFGTRLEPSVVQGRPERLDRAVWNLLENAGKWSQNGGPIEVAVHGGELTVRDHGPGIAPEDKPHVFDRFYRATSARGMPGSGLGLAIVQDVANEHGGAVAIEDAPGGGTIVSLKLRASGEKVGE